MVSHTTRLVCYANSARRPGLPHTQRHKGTVYYLYLYLSIYLSIYLFIQTQLLCAAEMLSHELVLCSPVSVP